jgi:hypothetical protein
MCELRTVTSCRAITSGLIWLTAANWSGQRFRRPATFQDSRLQITNTAPMHDAELPLGTPWQRRL